tara:strand:+ start:2985 stop:3509 length:525 start_codon:yes stop_codon:yes gene_type:complete
MANITSYPAISTVTSGDLIVISDVSTTNNATKTTTVGKLGDFIGSTQTLGYKTYAVELSNFGGGAVAPTATVMQNTLGVIAWTRTSVGKYVGTLASAFTAAKTLITTQSQTVANPSIGANGVNGVTDTNEWPAQVRASVTSVNTVELDHFVLAQSGAATKSDNIKIFLEIKVYD